MLCPVRSSSSGRTRNSPLPECPSMISCTWSIRSWTSSERPSARFCRESGNVLSPKVLFGGPIAGRHRLVRVLPCADPPGGPYRYWSWRSRIAVHAKKFYRRVRSTSLRPIMRSKMEVFPFFSLSLSPLLRAFDLFPLSFFLQFESHRMDV